MSGVRCQNFLSTGAYRSIGSDPMGDREQHGRANAQTPHLENWAIKIMNSKSQQDRSREGSPYALTPETRNLIAQLERFQRKTQ